MAAILFGELVGLVWQPTHHLIQEMQSATFYCCSVLADKHFGILFDRKLKDPSSMDEV